MYFIYNILAGVYLTPSEPKKVAQGAGLCLGFVVSSPRGFGADSQPDERHQKNEATNVL